MKLKEFNALETAKMQDELVRCNGSSNWVKKMLAAAPYADMLEVHDKADEMWNQCGPDDFKEAYSHHPKIGNVELKEKFAKTASWSKGEQAGVAVATEKVIEELTDLNLEYEKKHGFIFIVCATGKTAEEMLDILRERFPNSTDKEIGIAAEEQRKITHIRINKLLS